MNRQAAAVKSQQLYPPEHHHHRLGARAEYDALPAEHSAQYRMAGLQQRMADGHHADAAAILSKMPSSRMGGQEVRMW